MKHFLIEATYLVPFDEIADVIPAHVAFLQKGYERGLFLFSGPKEPATGGLIVARAESQDELEAFLQDDPFRAGNYASYAFTQFDPVMKQGWTERWFG